METTYSILTRVKGNIIASEVEYIIDQLKFENGYFKYGDCSFEVIILGDERNEIIGFNKNQFPPSLVMSNKHYPEIGEFNWMLDDLVLVEV